MSDYLEDGEPRDHLYWLSKRLEEQRWGPQASGGAGLDDKINIRKHEPVDQKAKVSGHGHGHDGDRFRWETADTTKGPVLNSLWVVKSVLPRHGIGAMFGRSGSGKTFLATDIGLHVAAGIPWRGHRMFRWTWPTARWKRAVWAETEFTRGHPITGALGHRAFASHRSFSI